MKRYLMSTMGPPLAVVVAASLATVPARAAITWDLQPAGTGEWDWNLGGFNLSFPLTDPVTGLNFYEWAGISWNPAAAHCLEITTTPGYNTPNPDTRIWIYDHGTYRSINDDFGGTYQSKARLWIGRTGSSLEWYIHIQAYSAYHNSEDFHFSITRRDLTQAACTTGQTTIPWASIVGANSEYTVTLSPNAS
jgi:hypothetical protein